MDIQVGIFSNILIILDKKYSMVLANYTRAQAQGWVPCINVWEIKDM